MKRPGVTTFLLLLLAAVPAMVALLRLYQIPTGTLPTESLHFAPHPVSHFLHAMTGASFALIAPLQLHPGLRRRFPTLHRRLGWVLVAGGTTIAISGLVMLVLYPAAATLPLKATRLVVGSAVLACLYLSIEAVRHRDISGHRIWMLRTYALIMGAGTQAVVILLIVLLYGQPSPAAMDVIVALCWPFNLAVAELVIRGYRLPRWNGSASTAPNRS
ncbi:MAG: DUF2306 domain-containing protein [bacterium]